MKKLISLILVMMLSIAIAVPAFAAGTSSADLSAAIEKAYSMNLITVSQADEVNGIIRDLNDAALGQIDLAALKTVVKANEPAIKNGTVKLSEIVNDINKHFGTSGIQIAFDHAEINGTQLTSDVIITVPAAALKSNTAINKTVRASNGGEREPFYGSETPAANAANPVKATGMDMNFAGIAVLGFAFVSVLGCAVVATRKLASAE